MSAECCRRFWISGKVQGVFFRGSTQDRALSLGLRGYVRNLSDGRVEVLACGDVMHMEALESWLWQGPELAEVSGVEIEEVDADPANTFELR